MNRFKWHARLRPFGAFTNFDVRKESMNGTDLSQQSCTDGPLVFIGDKHLFD